jgi:hypothetical protein
MVIVLTKAVGVKTINLFTLKLGKHEQKEETMELFDKILEAATEIKRLQSAETQLGQAKDKIAKLEEEAKKEAELLELLFPVVCPEEHASLLTRIEKQASADSWSSSRVESANAFLSRPKAIGHTVLCTYDDPGADSAANDSQYSLFILVSDGRVLPVVSLGLYGGAFSERIPSAMELIAKKLPLIEPRDITKKAPQCVEEAHKASDKSI